MYTSKVGRKTNWYVAIMRRARDRGGLQSANAHMTAATLMFILTLLTLPYNNKHTATQLTNFSKTATTARSMPATAHTDSQQPTTPRNAKKPKQTCNTQNNTHTPRNPRHKNISEAAPTSRTTDRNQHRTANSTLLPQTHPQTPSNRRATHM